MSVCDVCGCVYKWEMFFHNHLRDVHGIHTAQSSRKRLKEKSIKFLDEYRKNICSKPTLDEIEELSDFLNLKKESVYWWFVNRNKKQKAKHHTKSVSVKLDVGRERRDDRVPPGFIKGGKRQEKKTKRNQCDSNKRTECETRKNGD